MTNNAPAGEVLKPAAAPTLEEPATPGTSVRYLGGAPLRRYVLWFALAMVAMTVVWGASGILLSNQVQQLAFRNWFTGADASVDLVQLQALRDHIAAGTSVATADQQRQLDLLAGFETTRAQALGLITAISLIGTMLIAPVVGVFSDRTRSRFGRRAPWILPGGLVGAVLLIGVRYAPSLALLAVLWTLAGLALAIGQGPLSATVADRIPENKRGTVSAAAGFGSFLGGILGGIGAGVGFAIIGLDLYYVFAVAVAVASVCFVAFVKDRSSVELSVSQHRWGSFFKGFLVPLRAKDFRWVWIARVLLTFGYAVPSALGLFMMQSYIRPHLSLAEATALMPVLMLCGAPGTLLAVLVAGRLSDRIGRRKPFVIAASFLMATAMLIPLIFPTLPALIAQGIAAGIAFGIYLPVDQALFVDVLPDLGSAGRDLGVAGLGSNLGQALGPILAAQIVAATGSYGLVWPVAAVLVAAAGLAIFRVKGAR